jgi:hypothetical protein
MAPGASNIWLQIFRLGHPIELVEACVHAGLYDGHAGVEGAGPIWARNCSIASFIGAGRSPHQSITPTHRFFDGSQHFLHCNFTVGFAIALSPILQY